jgi:hypothetical protein
MKQALFKSSTSEKIILMKRRKITPMTRSQLEALPTKRLLARLNRLRRVEESIALSDREPDEHEAPGFIEFKDNPEWIVEYNCLKELLAEREHISRQNG